MLETQLRKLEIKIVVLSEATDALILANTLLSMKKLILMKVLENTGMNAKKNKTKQLITGA